MEDESEKKLETQESEENVVDSDIIVEELADEYSEVNNCTFSRLYAK
jgi:hypothetical protein